MVLGGGREGLWERKMANVIVFYYQIVFQATLYSRLP